METKWTLGPWAVEHKRNIIPVGRSQLCVAVAERHDPNHEANARLIACAPEMFAILQHVIESDDVVFERADDIEFCRVVIAKALGHE